MTKNRLLYIGNKLSKHGSTTTVIETLGPLLAAEGFSVVYASDKKNQILRLADMIFTTLKFGKKVDFVLIDTYSTSGFYYALIVSQLCRLLQVKYIPILHGGNLPVRIAKNPFLAQLLFKNAYQNVAPSRYLHSAFQQQGYTNVTFIPNAISIADYFLASRSFTEPKLLWVRSFSSLYNPKMAISVFAQIQQVYPKAQLCMVGPGSHQVLEECKKLAVALQVDVLFTGKLSKSDWISLSKKCTIFINTTHFDNTPVSVIEAMALGLPVVSTNVGGIPFLLTHQQTALLVPDSDVNAMVNAIQEIMSNTDLRAQLIANARAEVVQFDWDIVKLKWFEILK